MAIENLFRYPALAVGLKPSANQGKARLRGLYRIISSKTISPRLTRAKPACAGYTGLFIQRPLFRSSVRTAIEQREGVTPAHPGSCGAACGRNAHAPRGGATHCGRAGTPAHHAGGDARAPRGLRRVGLKPIPIALPGGSSLPGKPTWLRASPAPGAPAAPARRGATTDSHRSACGQ